jgi:hypothetical protein
MKDFTIGYLSKEKYYISRGLFEYLTQRGDVIDWVESGLSLHEKTELVFFKTKAEAQTALDKYKNQMNPKNMTDIPDKFIILLYGEDHSKLVQQKLYELGCKWISGKQYSSYPTDRYPTNAALCISNGDITCSDAPFFVQELYSDYHRISTDQLLQFEVNPDIEIPLDSGKYTAAVNKKNVVVGCQTISFETVAKIWEAVKKMKE